MPQLEDAAGVATHYIDTGSGTSTLVLHGGLEDGETWQFFIDALAAAGRRVLAPDRRGHGRTPDVHGPYTYDAMADETIAFLEQVMDGPADLIGYSDGGIVALLVAKRRPDLVRRLVAISANYEAHGIVIAMRERMANADPDADRFEEQRADYANKSPDDPTHWPTFLAKVVGMGLDGSGHDLDELHDVNVPVLLVAADDDVVDLHYTVDQYLALPDAQLAVLPGTSHLLAHEKPDQLLGVLQDFLDAEPVERLMPMRTPTS